MPEGPTPDFGIYLLGKEPSAQPWPSRWVRWPDFWLPSDPSAFAEALREGLERSGAERVEFACGGGVGRTGTALACLAVLDGLPAHVAVDYVRRHYMKKAVETPWQKRFVRRFSPGL
ncbi:protein-tyrosine phosphatase family protein [Actinopolymorpha sp. NPDC004070]|uniref:protein-tyrosine phosphatase family protein n=1 Tax=Actinopolymorpha sp. NPDC004070 TaxID=3154548 RepID=UPI0033BD938D